MLRSYQVYCCNGFKPCLINPKWTEQCIFPQWNIKIFLQGKKKYYGSLLRHINEDIYYVEVCTYLYVYDDNSYVILFVDVINML